MSQGVNGEFTFENVPDGEYVVAIAGQTMTTKQRHDIVPLSKIFDGAEFQTNDVSQKIVIQNGVVSVPGLVDVNNEPETEIIFGVVHHAYSVTLTSKYGKFIFGTQNGNQDFGTEVDVNGTPLQVFTAYQGGLRTFEQNNNIFASNAGVLDGDRINNITDKLPEPTLSDEEKAMGITFVGWLAEPAYATPSSYDNSDLRTMAERYPTLAGSLLSPSDAISFVALDDITLRAVFNIPHHSVTFATNSDKGQINDKDNNKASYVEKQFEGNNKKIAELPTVQAKPGYKFLGWYADLTENVIPETELKEMVVNQNLKFYAKYEKADPEVSNIPVINPISEGDTKVTGIGINGSKIKVTFPDGTSKETTVNNNEWSIDFTRPFKYGEQINANQTEVQEGVEKLVSPIVSQTVVNPKKSENPIVLAVKEEAAAVTGKGIAGSTIIVTFKDGSKVATTVAENGTWSVEVPKTAALKKGDNVSVVQIEKDKLPSSAVDATAVLDEKADALKPKTSFVEEGTNAELSPTVEGLVSKKDIPNYKYVTTEVVDGNLVHVYKKVDEKPDKPEQPETTTTSTHTTTKVPSIPTVSTPVRPSVSTSKSMHNTQSTATKETSAVATLPKTGTQDGTLFVVIGLLLTVVGIVVYKKNNA
ncbi:LPXTG cell wall anchor domain-containing protein [Granulicatella sp. zg-ZJ]|uniref:Ig-like domain-containing protein n=1 Tax=Granulicatella sp. zg-ZJ TaxID=2678504 RepID=UPI0013D1A364|nr:LPXTG cell wall anchor domain-containing protein [Granulicatella sp. zg-ZJ]